ncbi:MAG: Pirin-like protein [Comamonadaceae bacterium]|nr:MAG: Pirin-like protein [Comamonadaceae bacterium]
MTTPTPIAITITHPRNVEKLITGQATSDGAGVKLTRVLTQDLQQRLDPFLMLDAFGSDQPDDYIAGFPDPGHTGLLEDGAVQWMTAARGVIHSEIPQQQNGVMEGFQLWLNLPARDKMNPPWYRDFQSADLPKFVTPQGVAVTVIAGSSHGITGAVTREATAPLYLDLHLSAGARFEQPLPAGHNAFVYVYRGAVRIAGQTVPAQRMALLANEAQSDGVVIEASEDAKALLIAGRPLHEPIVQHGPFVMNTVQEIHQAVRDYHAGLLGEIAH